MIIYILHAVHFLHEHNVIHTGKSTVQSILELARLTQEI